MMSNEELKEYGARARDLRAKAVKAQKEGSGTDQIISFLDWRQYVAENRPKVMGMFKHPTIDKTIQEDRDFRTISDPAYLTTLILLFKKASEEHDLEHLSVEESVEVMQVLQEKVEKLLEDAN
ncbi:hypothetical protein [Shouchella hunanensis]|uniref:Uncharacterized protein n=1 Tax=Shouchella hunanensis TaxID=766894 RepID=A0ABY7W2E9_9BACI|nr:hypothetical protein [Shouchella hunanensis]WDF02751.1 hypothetical protein PQ477_14745 [Shouchella hunanensis]